MSLLSQDSFSSINNFSVVYHRHFQYRKSRKVKIVQFIVNIALIIVSELCFYPILAKQLGRLFTRVHTSNKSHIGYNLHTIMN